MKFVNAKCKVCEQWIDAPYEGAFFRIHAKRIYAVDLRGEPPGEGVFCVCDYCMLVMEDVQDRKDRGVS